MNALIVEHVENKFEFFLKDIENAESNTNTSNIYIFWIFLKADNKMMKKKSDYDTFNGSFLSLGSKLHFLFSFQSIFFKK
jgi:hypothetical protein